MGGGGLDSQTWAWAWLVGRDCTVQWLSAQGKVQQWGWQNPFFQPPQPSGEQQLEGTRWAAVD